MAQTLPGEIFRKASVRQFIKFCIIGASSTIIDWGIFSILFNRNWNPNVAQLTSFSIAVTNGFMWNSHWTFRGLGTGRKHEQFVKFCAVNLIGLALTLIIINTVFYLLDGRLLHKGETDRIHTFLSKGVALVLVVSWNFLANKRWTFRGMPAESVSSEG